MNATKRHLFYRNDHTYANLKCFHLKEKEVLHDTTNTILQSYADILKIAEKSD